MCVKKTYAAIIPPALALALVVPVVGHIVVISAIPLLKRYVVWFKLRPATLLMGIVVYIVVFILDYLTMGPPSYTPAWWVVVILVPLAEEFIFRALAFSLLPHPLSWAFATVIFGVLHQSNPLLATLYGVALSLTYRGGGYLLSVVMHAVNNAVWLTASVL